MKNFLQYIVILGTVANLYGSYFYLRDTLRGRVKPNRVSWLLWSTAPLIAAVAAFSDGARWAVLPVFMSGFCPLLIFIGSFLNRQAYWRLEKFDYLCGLFSILALIFWAITKQPLVAIIFSVLSDGLAAVPTIVKGYRHPETELPIVYLVGIFSALTGFLVLKTFALTEILFPIYLVLVNSALAGSVYLGRARRPNTNPAFNSNRKIG
ncbi:MAG TPA: hypothetical protein PLR18_04545 [bacterium]|nr:hypothetical protein [bacterium]